MPNDFECNSLNWNNLISLCRKSAALENKITLVTKPFTAFYTSEYAWPNFVMLDDEMHSLENHITLLSQMITEKKLPPYIILHPNFTLTDDIVELLEANGIRQYSRWINIYYDMNQGLMEDFDIPDFRIERVMDKQSRDIWSEINSRVFHKGTPIPSDTFDNDDTILLLGYSGDTPSTTMMSYYDGKSACTYYGAVLPEFRNKGYGKKIMRTALEYLQKSNIEIVLGQSSQMGLKSWTNVGYKQTGYINNFLKFE